MIYEYLGNSEDVYNSKQLTLSTFHGATHYSRVSGVKW
jgi:hypothetical protein